ncbi:tetratricopeptide repeat protein [Mucilaginibacter sp. RCC_168]|uniref:tetratricopeptide repeat protein n=1 Tax=Mucilaginibacter sp. RCC_168 TaxID=3239221 RepID=UPI0035250ADA
MMMKYLLAFLLSFTYVCGFAQQISYEEWKKESKDNIRLLPEYGHVPKTAEQIEADQRLIDTELKQNGTHRKASDQLIKLGFSYLYQGDIKTAMYRFNQAYLLDPKNENIYWGFGAVYSSFNDSKAAIAQYDKGLAMNPISSVILTDKATIYFIDSQKDGSQEKLNTAIKLLTTSYGIDAANMNTTYKLSVCYFLRKDCVNAWKFYNECMKQGGQPIVKEYTEALKKQCNK